MSGATLPEELTNFVGVMAYACVAVLAVRADLRQRSWIEGRHRWHWPTIAVAFALLACWRFVGEEHHLHDVARSTSLALGDYRSRRLIQVPVVLALLTGTVLTFRWLIKRLANSPQPVRLSGFSTAALLAYTTIRAVSLHAIDRVLYAGFGPFHLNHIIDLGLTALVGWSALRAIQSNSTPSSIV